jgi:hypothetical protein
MNPLYPQTEKTSAEVQHEEQLELDNWIDLLTSGSPSYFRSIFLDMASANPENAELLCKFVSVECNTCNIKPSTKQTHIKVICWFDKYVGHKDFSKLRREDFIAYFASLRKEELEDPTHKWIGTYNTRHMILSKFFKWIYNQNELDYKKWIMPPCSQGMKPLPRREITIQAI